MWVIIFDTLIRRELIKMINYFKNGKDFTNDLK
jgi:hypothetical protein